MSDQERFDDFEVDQAEITLQAHFSEPVLDLFSDFPAFLKIALSRLGPLGVRLADSRFESTTDHLGEMHLRCFLENGTQGVRFYLDRIELWAARGGWDALIKLLAASIAGVYAHRDIAIQTFNAAVAAHGRSQGQTAPEVLSRLNVSPPGGFGPFVASGATFYFGPEAGRLASILTFDLSAHFSGAIFIRLHQVYDGQAVAAEFVVPRLRQSFEQTLAYLGLQAEAK